MISAIKGQYLGFGILHIMQYKTLKPKGFLLPEMRNSELTGNIEKRKGPMQSTDPFSNSSQAQAAKPLKACIYNKRATAWLKA